jgi:rod shape determining protein RodA
MVTINPARDPKGAGYQVIQSRIAVGSGGFVGKGLFSGTQSQLDFLPARHTDFIYSVIAEEAGFLGAASVVALYLLLLQRLLLAATLARDRLGFFLVMCLCGVLGVHLVLNLGMALGLLPTIGIPLPLLSYGGSSMLATMFALGLCYSVRMRRFVEPE